MLTCPGTCSCGLTCAPWWGRVSGHLLTARTISMQTAISSVWNLSNCSSAPAGFALGAFFSVARADSRVNSTIGIRTSFLKLIV